MEAIIVALIEYVGVPLVMKLIAARTPRAEAVATLEAQYDALKLAADAAATAIIEAP